MALRIQLEHPILFCFLLTSRLIYTVVTATLISPSDTSLRSLIRASSKQSPVDRYIQITDIYLGSAKQNMTNIGSGNESENLIYLFICQAKNQVR